MTNKEIRKALLEMDKATDCKYDLTSLYEACKWDKKEDKDQLVKYIGNADPKKMNDFLSNQFDSSSASATLSECSSMPSDDLTEEEMKDTLKFVDNRMGSILHGDDDFGYDEYDIDDINDGEDHNPDVTMKKQFNERFMDLQGTVEDNIKLGSTVMGALGTMGLLASDDGEREDCEDDQETLNENQIMDAFIRVDDVKVEDINRIIDELGYNGALETEQAFGENYVRIYGDRNSLKQFMDDYNHEVGELEMRLIDESLTEGKGQDAIYRFGFSMSDDEEIQSDEDLRAVLKEFQAEGVNHNVKVSARGDQFNDTYMYEFSFEGTMKDLEEMLRSDRYVNFFLNGNRNDLADELNFLHNRAYAIQDDSLTEDKVHMTSDYEFNPLVMTKSLVIDQQVYDPKTGKKLTVKSIDDSQKYFRTIEFEDEDGNVKKQSPGINYLWELVMDGDFEIDVPEDDYEPDWYAEDQRDVWQNESLKEGTVGRIASKVKSAVNAEMRKDKYERKLEDFIDKFKKEFNIDDKVHNTGYGYSKEGDKEYRTYRMYIKPESERDLDQFFVDGKMWLGLKPEYKDRFVRYNDTNRKASYEMRDGEIQVEFSPGRIYFDMRVEIPADKAKKMRDKEIERWKKESVNESLEDQINFYSQKLRFQDLPDDTSVEMDKYLDFYWGTDRDKDNSKEFEDSYGEPVEEGLTLKEDWRDGTFTQKDYDEWEQKMMDHLWRMENSCKANLKKHPEFKDQIKAFIVNARNTFANLLTSEKGLTEALSRKALISEIDRFRVNNDRSEDIEEILLRHNASDDDSDPTEGFYVTMSNSDLQDALIEIKDLFEISDMSLEDIKSKISDLSTRYDQSKLSGYEEGWYEGASEALAACGESLFEGLNEGWFSDDDVEDDYEHTNLYGGDPMYCKYCGTKLIYDDGYPVCPECNKEEE